MIYDDRDLDRIAEIYTERSRFWLAEGENGKKSMFSRVKLHLSPLRWARVEVAARAGTPIVLRLSLLGKNGGPVCASIPDDAVHWPEYGCVGQRGQGDLLMTKRLRSPLLLACAVLLAVVVLTGACRGPQKTAAPPEMWYFDITPGSAADLKWEKLVVRKRSETNDNEPGGIGRYRNVVFEISEYKPGSACKWLFGKDLGIGPTCDYKTDEDGAKEAARYLLMQFYGARCKYLGTHP